MDGFRPESHGRFRGDRDSFATTVATVRALAAAGLLQGLLCTPNSLAQDGEYRELCEFAAENGAAYVLMNPLSSMGRGVKATWPAGRHRGAHAPHSRPDRPVPATPAWTWCTSGSPAPAARPLAGCQAGTIIYVFTPRRGHRLPLPGVRRPDSAVQARPGRVHRRQHLRRPRHRCPSGRLTTSRDRYPMGANPTCRFMRHRRIQCGKGCPAAVISAGERIGAVDAEVCPVTSGERRLLPLMPA